MKITPDYSKEFQRIVDIYEKAGGKAENLLRGDVASVIISGNKVLGLNNVRGMAMESSVEGDAVLINLKVAEGAKILYPVHLCVGALEKEGEQRIVFEIDVGAGAVVNFLSHCSFPFAYDFLHFMKAVFRLGKGARVFYEDHHFHSESGGTNVKATYSVKLDTQAHFENRFYLTTTRVGKLEVEMESNNDGEDSVAHLETKIYERADDRVEVREKLFLNAPGASGILKTSIFATDNSYANVINEAYGNAPHVRGHVECTEVVKGDRVQVGTVPVLRVQYDTCELTHEASIGRVNTKQLQTLMAKGLSEDEATELIVKGLLR
ncbi:MAG: uncharacterized protein PWP37_813 [Thermotogota bacterium]|nr:uncharacterized protein [Thermotogota bacterium]